MGSEADPGVAAHVSWEEMRQRALAGDKSAESQLLGEIRAYLKQELEKRHTLSCGGSEDASDIAQNCLLDIWQHLQDVRGNTAAQVEAWVRAVGRNGNLDAARHARQQQRDIRRQIALPQDSQGGMLLAADTSSPSQRATHHEEEALREKALGRLDADDRQVLRLRFQEERTWPEIAQDMGRSEAAVKRLYYRAVKRWKDALGTNS
jgi:RNA polymerase sigma-70 factor, ECF subfamily